MLRQWKASSWCQGCLVVSFQYERIGSENTGILTGCRQRIVVGAQAEEKEQRCEPDADPKKGRHITEGGRFHHGPAAVCLVGHLTCVVRDMCEMEEPHKMVDDD